MVEEVRTLVHTVVNLGVNAIHNLIGLGVGAIIPSSGVIVRVGLDKVSLDDEAI